MTYWRDDTCSHRRWFRVWTDGTVLVVCVRCGQTENGADARRTFLERAPAERIAKVARYIA